MFGIGGTELIIIIIVALLIFGPNKLPELGRTIGKMMSEFKRASSEMEQAVRREMDAAQAGAAPEGDVMAAARESAADAEPLTPAAGSAAEAYDDDFAYEDEDDEDEE